MKFFSLYFISLWVCFVFFFLPNFTFEISQKKSQGQYSANLFGPFCSFLQLSSPARISEPGKWRSPSLRRSHSLCTHSYVQDSVRVLSLVDSCDGRNGTRKRSIPADAPIAFSLKPHTPSSPSLIPCSPVPCHHLCATSPELCPIETTLQMESRIM